jgi:hypothetical protein
VKNIINYLKEQIRIDFNPFVYIYFFLFLASAIFLNYYFHFESHFLGTKINTCLGLLFYFIFYSFAYYGIAIPKLFIQKRKEVLLKKPFWIKSFFFLLLISVAATVHFSGKTTNFSLINEYSFSFRLLNQFKCTLLYVIPLLILKKIYDTKVEGLYGLRIKGQNLKIYFILLLIVCPMIIAASFTPDFLKAYPRFKPWIVGSAFGLNKLSMTGIFESFYALDFVMVELMFRGALIIGMAAILGKDAILPMVAAYAFIHFSKPLGEAISSVFGGYILGVIALKTRNILGGCIIHIGIAYLMEIMGFIQFYILQTRQ